MGKKILFVTTRSPFSNTFSGTPTLGPLISPAKSLILFGISDIQVTSLVGVE